MDHRNSTAFSARFPNELLEQLRELASQSDRSINSELLQAARHWIATHQTQKQGDTK